MPADIYSSGIICEAGGIDVHLRLLSEETPVGNDGKSEGGPHPSVNDVGDQILPNPTDLAESFLETEAKEEKDELQAAISSQSQVLHRSASSSDDEDEVGLGVEGLSLPSFVAAFLKGVADRLQVRVNDISIWVDMEVRQDRPRRQEDKADLVTGLLSVREVNMGAVSRLSGPVEIASGTEGKRLVSLSDIDMALVSDPIVFSNYSRFASPSSPSTTMHSKESRFPSRVPSPPPEDSSPTDLDMARSSIVQPPENTGATPEHNPGMEASTYTYDGRFSDADTEEEIRSDKDFDGSHLSDDDGLLDNPAYLDSVIDSQMYDEDIEGSGRLSPGEKQVEQPVDNGETPRSHSPQLHTSGNTEGGRDTEKTEGDTESGPDVQGRGSNESVGIEHVDFARGESLDPPREDSSNSNGPSRESTLSEHGSGDSQSGSIDIELSESKLYSSEDAQSMYMSAISHASTSKSFMPSMPGAWDEPARPRASRHLSGVQEEHGRDEQDETAVSTPKLTAQASPYPSGQGRVMSQSDVSDRESDRSSPVSNRGTNVAKKFFAVDQISVWFPSTDVDEDADLRPHSSYHEDLKASEAILRQSTVDDSLIESRSYASDGLRRNSADSAFLANTRPTLHRPEKDQRPDFSDERRKTAIKVSSIEVRFDIATGWLLVKMGQKIAHALDRNAKEQPKTSRLEENRGRQAYDLVLSNLSVKFVEHIPGSAYPSESLLHTSPSFRTSVEDVVLQATASELKTQYASGDGVTNFGLDVSKFAIGFASEDLLSFDENLKMRESTRDMQSPVRGDISLSLTKSSQSARVNLATLPLQFNLNIQRLEEVLGWLGGVSTILEVGSSFSSVSPSKGTWKEAKRPRGVHFETAPPPEVKRTDSLPWKVNARLGGIAMDLVGENHYLKLRTTAVKAVSRFEGIGIQIDKAKLSGPFTLDDGQEPPAKISLGNIRLEYLYQPKEVDLDRLLALITPSKDKYDEDDDIMLDTLFRQRRQGSVLRVTVSGLKTVVSNTGDLESLTQLGSELGKLSNVTKYLPEDDRPGILILALIRDLEGQVHVGEQIGDIGTRLRNVETAYITMPSLVAAQVETLTAVRNGNEELLGEALPLGRDGQMPPVLMARFIPDEMDPTIKVKLHNLRAEYTIQSMAAFLGLGDDMTGGRMATNMAKSLANLAELPEESPSYSPESLKGPVKPTKLTVVLRDSVLGLNPRGTPAKGLLAFTSSKFSAAIHGQESSEATLDLRKASVMIIDDAKNIGLESRQRRSVAQSDQIQSLIDLGYVPVSTLSSATVTAKLMRLSDDGTKSVDVELRDNLLILETCADSTQTLIAIMNGLQPPTPPSATLKYRTEVMPIQDMLASFTGDAFAADTEAGPECFSGSADHGSEGPIDDELEYVSDFYPERPGAEEAPDFAGSGSGELLDSFHSQYHVSSSISELDFREDHFAKQSDVGGTAHRWDSTQNTYGLSNDEKLRKSPLRVRVRDVHVIWNLFDGYDWPRTRDAISKAVNDVEIRATDRRARSGSRASPGMEEEEESVIGDCLFNSVYIGIPAHKDPRDLRADINRNIDDLVSETGSYATTTTVTATRPSQSPSVRRKKLRLSRSKRHKMTFELKGICADLVVFPPDSEETQSSLDVRVDDLEIFDHVPTSTWKKFASYMRESGEKESGTSMIHLEILTVKPVPELAASEIVLKVGDHPNKLTNVLTSQATILPLRLHVDQDALDFMSRFFEFRDESEPQGPPGEVPFLQRVEVNAVPVRLDFKPKRVDYGGLRSGRTTEFMNFFVLDAADMVLRHVIIYGVSGFDRLGHTLNDIWMPDIKRNQLPSVLAGLAPIRSLVNVGGGVRDLVVVPMREYRKDGRIVRSIQKGALAFAKTTSNELVKLGAKLAIGTQTVLQGAEDLLNTPSGPLVTSEEDSVDEEEAKKISLYADQPIGVVQGLRGAYSGLERDLLLARDAIVAVPGEVVDSGSAKAAAQAVWKRAPTVVLRPAIGVSKAVGQTLLGAGNTLDPGNRRKMEDVSSFPYG